MYHIRTVALLIAVTVTCGAPASSSSHDNSIMDDKKEPSTHELLSSLGLKKLRIPAAHHRKRLAEQGRRHATGDSRMFVITPPNTSYYTHADPAPAAARTLPLQMTSNGKPARVYHWNIPVLQKLAKNRPQARFDDDVVDVESTPTWPKGVNNHPNSLDALAYYVPAKKTSFRKYFSGNGKPKSFYIIEKNKKTAEYHRLLP
ncbi:LOW QUALITY PROTEIN: uncharacterized protein ACR2FA_006718 [Aphomia sociella]